MLVWALLSLDRKEPILRATGATWMAVRGDDPLKIKQRCGHSTFSTTEMYIREAEAVRDGFGEVFPPLPEGLLGMQGEYRNGFATLRNRAPIRAKNKRFTAERAGFERVGEPPETEVILVGSESVAERPESESAPVATVQSTPAPVRASESQTEATDAELERAIVDAVTMGLGEVARALARRLEERRADCAANVVRLSRTGRS